MTKKIILILGLIGLLAFVVWGMWLRPSAPVQIVLPAASPKTPTQIISESETIEHTIGVLPDGSLRELTIRTKVTISGALAPAPIEPVLRDLSLMVRLHRNSDGYTPSTE